MVTGLRTNISFIFSLFLLGSRSRCQGSSTSIVLRVFRSTMIDMNYGLRPLLVGHRSIRFEMRSLMTFLDFYVVFRVKGGTLRYSDNGNLLNSRRSTLGFCLFNETVLTKFVLLPL